MLKLYDYPDCPFCQKVRVVLAEKDLEFEKIFVDLRRQEQKTPEFLRLNPYGKVPVLVDEDEVIFDSTIINEYLEDEYPLPHLLPEDSQARLRASQHGLSLLFQRWRARVLAPSFGDAVAIQCRR